MKKKFFKISIFLFFLFVIFLSVGFLMVYFQREGSFQKDKVYEYGVVFGAAIRSKNRLSKTLESRMDSAITLYKEGSIKKILLSGAKIGQIKPGEPMAMFHYALSKGVRPEDLLLDEAGDNTLATIANTRRLIPGASQRSILFISSYFHLARIDLTASIAGFKNYHTYSSDTEHPRIVYFVFREAVAIWYYLLLSLFYF